MSHQRCHHEVPYELQRKPQEHWVPLILLDLLEEIHLIRVTLQSAFAPKLTRLGITIMPKTINVGETATILITGTGTDGKPWTFSAADNLALAAATPSDVSFAAPTFNADGSASVVVTGVNADPGDSITASADGVTSNSDTLTIVTPAPKLASMTLAIQ